MDETPRETTDDDEGERPTSTRSVPEILSALRRAAGGLEANMREAARLLRRRGRSSNRAA